MGHFTVAESASLIPKLRDNFAEFLGNSSLAHLRLLALTTCVGLGTGNGKISLEAFLKTGYISLRYLIACSLVFAS